MYVFKKDFGQIFLFLVPFLDHFVVGGEYIRPKLIHKVRPIDRSTLQKIFK